MKQTLVVGTRTSKLARWQTQFIIESLQRAWRGLECQTKLFRTEGDLKIDQPLPEIGGKGLFTERLERALRGGEIDIAVHSLKDLPVKDSPGLVIGAITSRVDPRDVLISARGYTLETLPKGAIVGTSSNRRRAQLLLTRPDLDIRDIRGNVETRVRKVLDGDYDAAMLAAAGVERLGIDNCQIVPIELDVMLPAPGQAALAIQCRDDDSKTLRLLSGIEDDDVREAVTAERMFLLGLGGGCSAPVAAYARRNADGKIVLKGLVASTEGATAIRVMDDDVEGAVLGVRLAREAIDRGAGEILDEIRTPQANPNPLARRRIVVTRAAEQADGLCDAIAQLGATPVRIPTIRIEPTDDPTIAERINQADWVVMTSANGVHALWHALNSKTDGAIFDGVKVAAVGPATQAALQEKGVKADFVPDEFTGEAIARGLNDVSGKHILLLRAETAGHVVVDVLKKRGATVEDISVYRTLPAVIESLQLETLAGGVDALSFTSGSTARRFVEAWRDSGRDAAAFDQVPVFCIGPVTEAVVRDLGFRTRIMADEYTTEGLVSAMVRHFSKEQ